MGTSAHVPGTRKWALLRRPARCGPSASPMNCPFPPMLNLYSSRHRALGFWLVAVALFAARPVAALDCAWIDGNSMWSSASSWSCGVVPGASDNVTINTFVTVTLDTDVTVGAFSLSNGLL